jgi:hypothetical protein
VTIKLLWLPSKDVYGLRVFVGDKTEKRPFIGELRLPPAYAAQFRAVLLAGESTLDERLFSEAGWEQPGVSS